MIFKILLYFIVYVFGQLCQERLTIQNAVDLKKCRFKTFKPKTRRGKFKSQEIRNKWLNEFK